VKILGVADSFVTRDMFERALSRLAAVADVRVVMLNEDAVLTPSTPSERRIHEYFGHPRQLIAELTDEEVLVVHGAPVTDAVLDASPRLRLVCCVRGGAVNVDVEAATARGIPVIVAPGRNAEAVADLTLAFMVMLARGIPRAQRYVATHEHIGVSNFEGAQFFGHELGAHILGLIGYGRVGARVATRALSFGMSVAVYDPYVERSRIEAPGITVARLEKVVSTSDFVSLHLRATPENRDFFGARLFGLMKPSAFFINTARASLVDEMVLYHALTSGAIAGAALDFLKAPPTPTPTPLRLLENVVVTPHIGGATYEAGYRGVELATRQIERYIARQRVENVLNPAALAAERR
jgi:D-3-phosphoglycerate dehydrogenase